MESEKQKLFVTYISQEEFIDKTTISIPLRSDSRSYHKWQSVTSGKTINTFLDVRILTIPAS